jgi:hypothetical protein
MEIVDKVYESLQENIGNPKEIWVEDLISVGCGYRHWFTSQEGKNLTPKELLLKEVSSNMKAMVRGYLADCFPEFRQGATKVLGYPVHADIIGKIGNTLIEVVPVSTYEFKTGNLPKRVRMATAVKAHLWWAKDAYVILIDRDKQDWASWKLSGDFSEIGNLVEKEAAFIAGLYTEESAKIGTADVNTCRRCPFNGRCLADKVDSPAPYPDTTISSIDPWITRELDKYLYDLNKRGRSFISGRISPSHFSITECDRSVAYGLLKTREKPSIGAKLRRIFDTGHAVHDVIQTALAWAFPAFQAEVRMKMPEYRISGSCDGVLDDDGFEIKSIGSKGFDTLTKIKKDHNKQATLYGIGLQLKQMNYLYVNKETADIQSFKGPPDRQLWHQMADRAENIIKTVDSDELPPKLEGKEWACKKCGYAWKCRPELIGVTRKFRIRGQA